MRLLALYGFWLEAAMVVYLARGIKMGEGMSFRGASAKRASPE
jgi:hypothetical protein